MSTQKDISCGPTWRGRIETTEDALIVFGACFTGYLHYCLRRPKEAEWPQLIVSGNVFVYDEAVSGIKRWTDGKSWSPSRALGDFLLYRQVSEPGRKKAKPGGRKHRTNTDGKPNRFLVGSLVDSYDFQGDGLIKKTISIELLDIHHRVTHHHLVSYYTLNDADYLTTPKYDRFLKDCCIREALFDQLPFEYCFGTWTKKLGVNPSSSPNACQTKQVNSQYLHTNLPSLDPTITAQRRQLNLTETARNDTVPICSELGAAHTGDDIRTVISPLSTFQQNFRPNTNNGTSNFQNLLSNMNHASLHTNLAPAGSYSDDIRHHTPFPLTGAAEFVGGNADVPFQESYEISPTPTSVFQNLTGCHPSAGQNAPSNGHRADFWWSGILDTTWNSNLGQVEPFNEGMVDQRWSGEFGNDVPTNYQSTFSYDPLALQFLIMQKGAFE